MKDIDLSVPDEPTEIKRDIRRRIQRDRDKYSDDIDWESAESWWGNEVQSYLWREWKEELQPHGFTWQKFLKLMSYSTKDIVLWIREDTETTWEDVVKGIEGNLQDLRTFIVNG